DYLAAAFPELNAWERAGADASSAGMVDAGFENQKELTKMQLENQKKIAELKNKTKKKIAGIQSATSRQNTKDQVYEQNEMLAYVGLVAADLRNKKRLIKCNWTIRKRLPRCKMRLKKRLLAFSRRLHARIRKTRYMHKMRCLLINRRSLLLALRLLWKTPIFPSNSRFPRLCAKCLLKLKRLVSILPMTKSKK